MTTESTYPYPLRGSELVKTLPVELPITRLNLTEGGKNQVLQFEYPLFLKLKEATHDTVLDQVIYPKAFTNKIGRRLFEAIYLDPNLNERIKAFAANERVTNFEEEKDKRSLADSISKRKIHDKFFDYLLKLAETQEGFDKYRDEGKPTPRLGEEKEEEAERLIDDLFGKVDLKQIPNQLHDRMNFYSSEWAKEQFKTDFINAKGNVSLIQNPRRIRRIINPEVLEKKVNSLRKLKLTVKSIHSYLSKDEGNVPEAKRKVCQLYQRYINVLLADLHSYQTPTNDPNRSRKTERLDHFLNGVGIETGRDGLLQTIPEDLEKYCEERLSEAAPSDTPDFAKYNAVIPTADQVKLIAEKVLKEYGLLEGAGAWKVVVQDRKGLAVSSDAKEVRIPKDFKRGIVTTLAILAHEVEGHVLRFANKEGAFTGDLYLNKEFGTGRSALLSEGAAMWLEDTTRQKMVGLKDPALPYFYTALREKLKGGSFKECAKAAAVVKAKREYGLSLDELLRDEEKTRKVVGQSYASTLRIFRRFTDLNDTSGHLPISETLDYIEQEIVVDFLMRHQGSEAISKILFVSGVDLYSIEELLSIGFLNLDKVQVPKNMIALKFWPKIKESLDSGMNIDQAISVL